jgi:hypothetical protein
MSHVDPHTEDDSPITKITREFQRKDGSEARIVAEGMYGRGLKLSVDIRVFRRASPDQGWTLCSNNPHPKWREMSVAEYDQRGRSEMLQTVSSGEIMTVTSLIGQPMSVLH